MEYSGRESEDYQRQSRLVKESSEWNKSVGAEKKARERQKREEEKHTLQAKFKTL